VISPEAYRLALAGSRRFHLDRKSRQSGRPGVLSLLSLLALVVSICLPVLTTSAPAKEIRRVLVFYEAGFSFPDIAIVDQEIRIALDESPYQIELYTENMDEILFPDDATQQEFRNWYLHKYRDRKPDLIIAEGPPSIRFMSDVHERFFAGTPIVFCCSPQGRTDSLHLDSSFTGAWMEIDPAATLQVALRLQPSTRHVVVVGGVSSVDRNVEEITRKALLKYEGSFEFTYLTDLTMPTLLERLKHLPSDTIVFYTSLSRDAVGTSFIDPKESLPMILSVANAPVFVMSETFVGRGAVGGSATSFDAAGQVVAADAIEILKGKKPQQIPIVKNTNRYVFDWRALQHWGLKESALPRESILLNHPPNLWRIYKKYVLTVIFVIMAQSLAIFALLWQRAKRRKAEAVLRESEGRFRLVANTAPVMIWTSGTDKLRTYFNQPWLEFTGRSLQEELGNGWAARVHPEDLEPCLGTYSQAFDRRESFHMEYRLRRHDGEDRWIFDHGVPRFNADGSFAGFIGSCIDVTERKAAEEVLSSVSRKLIEAHEEERTWIARELHDDINQRIALLAVSLEGLKHDLPASNGQMSSRVKEVQEHVSDLGIDIQALSHRLHSSKLEYLGLGAAAEGFCKELSARQHVEIDFHSQDIPKELPKEIALCLFRVLQEALQNAVKHSGVRQFEVLLKARSNEIQLSVHDSGVGFDPEKAVNQHGLGLTSMKERLKLVDGSISIDSKLQSGTTIYARVPLAPRIEFPSRDPASPQTGENDRRRNLERRKSNTSLYEPIRDERKTQRRKNLDDRRDLRRFNARPLPK